MISNGPTHLVDKPGASRTLCGIRIKTGAALPYMHQFYLEIHRANRQEVNVCPTCEEHHDQ